MKQIASILSLLFLAVTIVAAQNTAGTAKAAAKGPAITFETETIDYGKIEQGADGIRVFKFKNTGTEPLIIKNAVGSCGCTVPTYSSQPILANETGEIKVKYDTNRVGPINKTVTVTTNADPETVRLTIIGEVLAKPQAPGVPSGQKNIINNN